MCKEKDPIRSEIGALFGLRKWPVYSRENNPI